MRIPAVAAAISRVRALAIDLRPEALEAQFVISIGADLSAIAELCRMLLAGAAGVTWNPTETTACAGGHTFLLSHAQLI